ncbi:MAG: hypothetical protein ACREKF_01900 [Candidatus Methylomirabilales bacterium]
MDRGLLPLTDVTSPQLRIRRLGKVRARSIPLIYLARGEWPGRLRPGELA